MRLDLKPFEQSVGMCGPASLVSLLGYHGLEYSEAALSKIVKGTSHDGTHPEDIVAGLWELGLEVVSGTDGSWEKLTELNQKGVPVLILWHSDIDGPPDGHYSVVADISEELLTIMDPQFGVYIEIPKEKFLANWHDTDPRTGEKINNWYLYVVHAGRR
jgi:ABC-type bacteriocin/lantibiotic exporter with double-glycine peptidase domain